MLIRCLNAVLAVFDEVSEEELEEARNDLCCWRRDRKLKALEKQQDFIGNKSFSSILSSRWRFFFTLNPLFELHLHGSFASQIERETRREQKFHLEMLQGF